MQTTLLPAEGSEELIFAPTTKAIRFYRSFLRKELADVLFVGVNDPVDPDSLIKTFSESTNEDKSKNDADFIDSAYERYKGA